MGTFIHARFDAGGIPHEVALTGVFDVDLERLCADLKVICEEHLARMGRVGCGLSGGGIAGPPAAPSFLPLCPVSAVHLSPFGSPLVLGLDSPDSLLTLRGARCVVTRCRLRRHTGLTCGV